MGKQRHRGVTLVEALTALSITATAVGTAVSNWAPYRNLHRMQGIASELSIDLQLARTEAVSRRQGVRITFSPTAAAPVCYVVHTGPATACDCARSEQATCGPDVTLIKRVAIDRRLGTSVRSNVRSLQFDGTLGTVTPTASITITAADGHSLRHVVNVIGRVRTCSPGGGFGSYRRC